jgi:hypothetical protein
MPANNSNMKMDKQLSILSGGCACHRVRYQCSERPLVQMICHCRDCQHASGGAFGALLIVPSDRLVFAGAGLTYHDAAADSGRTLRRGFCGHCGSPVSLRWPTAMPVEFLTAASLDDPGAFKPSLELYVARAPAWCPLHPDTQKFDEEAPDSVVRAPIAAYFAARAEPSASLNPPGPPAAGR